MKVSPLIKNFFNGYCSVLNLFPEKVSRPSFEKLNIAKNDREALQKDWQVIGQDIFSAISIVDKDIGNNGK